MHLTSKCSPGQNVKFPGKLLVKLQNLPSVWQTFPPAIGNISYEFIYLFISNSQHFLARSFMICQFLPGLFKFKGDSNSKCNLKQSILGPGLEIAQGHWGHDRGCPYTGPWCPRIVSSFKVSSFFSTEWPWSLCLMALKYVPFKIPNSSPALGYKRDFTPRYLKLYSNYDEFQGTNGGGN